MSAPTRVAVVGAGDISGVHFDAIDAIPGAELVAIGETHAGRLREATARHGVPGFVDHRELLAVVRPDVVHICTPHHQHASIAVDALEAGVHVIQEKPLAHTREDGRRLVDAAASSSAKIGICFQNRYNAPVQAAHALLSSGELGAVLGASGTVVWHRDADYYRSRPWRGAWATGGGGLLMNQAIHTLDLMQWLLGDVTRVRGGVATRFLQDDIEVEDTADMVLEHQGGARSTFYATLANVVNAPVTLDIVTERATLSLRDSLTVTHSDGRVDVVRERELHTGGRAYWGVSHELLIRDFYERLAEPGPFWIDPREAQKSLEVIQDVYDQSVSDRRRNKQS